VASNAQRNARRIAKRMLNAKHVRTQRTQLTYATKTKREIVKFLNARVGLWISELPGGWLRGERWGEFL